MMTDGLGYIRARLKGARFCLRVTLLLGAGLVAMSGLPAVAADGEPPAAQGAAPHPDVPPASSEPRPPSPEPQDYKMEDFRSPVPATLKGARVLTNDEAADLWNKAGGAIFLDVYPQAPKP